MTATKFALEWLFFSVVYDYFRSDSRVVSGDGILEPNPSALS